jgi:enoyl-CoA hydratase
MEYTTLLTQLSDNILVIAVNRPDKLNALNKTVMEELDLAMEEVYNNAAVKSAIITGVGDKAFVAGADIREFTGLSITTAKALAIKGQSLFFKIEQSPKPIIAAVNGFALGGGCELAMACHFRIASESAKFGQPEVNLGLIPGYGGTQRLTQLVGKGKALELMMSANMLTAEEAKQWGLVNHVVKHEDLLLKCMEILHTIQSKAPLAISGLIHAVNAGLDKKEDGYEAEINAFASCFGTEDVKEGTAAFLEKRVPDFKGR